MCAYCANVSLNFQAKPQVAHKRSIARCDCVNPIRAKSMLLNFPLPFTRHSSEVGELAAMSTRFRSILYLISIGNQRQDILAVCCCSNLLMYIDDNCWAVTVWLRWSAQEF
jgi:hypothetical protein